MKIHLKNDTDWRDRDLRRIYAEALRRAGATCNAPGMRVIVRLEVGTRRRKLDPNWRDWVTGKAELRMRMRPGKCWIVLPSPRRVEDAGITPEAFRDHVAQVMHHEALHAVGAMHGDMTEEQNFCRQPVPWAADLPLRARPIEVVNRTAAHANKLDHARAMLARAATRRRRATTIEKKWLRRVRLLERRAP